MKTTIIAALFIIMGNTWTGGCSVKSPGNHNLFTLDEMNAEGFEYHSVGRASIVPPQEEV